MPIRAAGEAIERRGDHSAKRWARRRGMKGLLAEVLSFTEQNRLAEPCSGGIPPRVRPHPLMGSRLRCALIKAELSGPGAERVAGYWRPEE
jgi:hypothetical protein